MDDLTGLIKEIVRTQGQTKEPDVGAESKFFIFPFYESVSVSDTVSQPVGKTTGTYYVDTAKIGESDYG